jgi:alpha-2-macroglobulin
MARKLQVCMLLILAGFAAACSTTSVKHLPDARSVYTDDGKKIAARSVIEGILVDSVTGKGIKGAKVEIKNANLGLGYYLRETDSSGSFKIEDFIPHVQYILEANADGYVPFKSNNQIGEGSLKISLTPEAILKGEVKNTKGIPLKDIEVKIRNYNDYYNENYSSKPVIVTTDSNGEYSINKLPQGSYLVTFTYPGFITETAQVKNIKKGESFSLPMVMIKPATISGLVLVKGLNSPAINVNVTLSGRVTHGTVTFQDGSYRIENVKPGNYKIIISHQGFYDQESQVLRIDEGSARENENFIVVPREPQLSLSAHRYTFTPGDSVHFNLRTFRVETVKVTIYEAPVDLLIKGGVNPDGLDTKEAGLVAVNTWDEPIRDFYPYEWRYQDLQVKSSLPTGGYCIEVKGADKVISRKFFTVTSTGIVMKRSQDSIFAYVTNLVTNAPVKDAKVALFDLTPDQKSKKKKYYKAPEKLEDLPANIVLQGKTDENGIFHENHKSSAYLSAIVISQDGSYAICNTGSPQSFEQEKRKYFIYTERPVYRAGDSVFYKIIAKKRENRFVPIQNEKVYYKIINYDLNKTVAESQLTLDDWGTADSKFILSKEANLGTYEILAGPSPKNLYSRGRFYVEQYRKPEFFIEINPVKDYYINGDTTEFEIEAKYFFGAPLKGALVKYRFYETKLRDFDTQYWWEEDYPESGSYNRIVMEGEKFADDNGVAVLRLHAGNYPYDRELTCEATIVDKSNISITSSNKVRVGRGEYYIKIEPQKNFFSSAEKKEIRLLTLTQSSKPISTSLKAELYRYIWKPWERVYVHENKPVFAQNITTDKNGSAMLELPKSFNLSGEFDLVVTGSDRKENLINASRVIWIYNPQGAQVASRFKNLELSLNETNLRKAGEITCLVKSCFTDAYVCLTLEGRDVYESKVIKMTGNIMPVTFNVKQEYAPNLFLTASMQRKRALYLVTEGIYLPVNDTELSISIETEKPKYKPGEKADVIIRVSDINGKPVKADLSLAAVDESIYYIRYDHTPLMKDYFYSKISNWVLTSYSYPITVLAGAGKDGKIKVREKFEDTAFWSAKIKTGADGIAKTNFTLPDNLTTWRLTVRGHDREGRVGEKKSTFLVTQDLIARIGKPRFLIENDSLSLIGIVNSNTERGLEKISTEFVIDKQKIEPDVKSSISLPAFGSSKNYYSYKVPANKTDVTVQFTAAGDRDASDAFKIKIPVEPRGVPYKLFGIGDMSGNKTISISPLKDTEDFNFVADSITVSINPSPIVQMLKAMNYLTTYPYGCIEQTLNSFIPNLAIKNLLDKKGYGDLIKEKAKKQLSEKVKTGIARIQEFQNDDGTWGWWAGGRGNGFVTGYVLYSLYIAKSAGYAVDMNRVNSGLNAFTVYFRNQKLEDTDAVAYLMYINALWGRWDNDIYEKMTKEKSQDLYSIVFTTRAMMIAEKNKNISDDNKKNFNKIITANIDSIIQQVKKDAKGVFWGSRDRDRWGWQGGDTELTAHILAMLTEAGTETTLPAQIVKSLSGRFKGDAWNSTKETANVILAICAYIEAKGGEPSIKGDVNFALDGQKIAEISYDMDSLKDWETLSKKVEVKRDVPRSVFTIEAGGSAGADLTYDVMITGTLYFKDKGFASFFKSEERSINSLSNGIKITRNLSAISRVKDMNNNEYLVPQSLEGKKEIQIGDELLVKVKFTAQDNFQYLVLEDYLPSGFEVTKLNAYDIYTPFIHQERWDNRMVYFFTDLNKGEVYEVAYIIRAELPGYFMVKPSRMECMYEPSIQGWSAPSVVEVKKK